MTAAQLLAMRDAILESLRTQFAAEVLSIDLRPQVCVGEQSPLDAFLRNCANNAAQGLEHLVAGEGP